MKQPVADTHGRPPCYGVGHNPADRLCRACDFARLCASRSAAWAACPSLAEQRAQVEASAVVVAEQPPMQVYAAIFQKHYGFDPCKPRHARARRTLARAEGFVAKAAAVCAEQNLNFAVYCTAQMHAFNAAKKKGWVQFRSFPPNWLSGPKALDRYRTYAYAAQSEYRTVTESTLDNRTAWGKIQIAVCDDEAAVADEFVLQHRLGAPVRWADAADIVSASEDWRAVTTAPACPTAALRRHYWRLHARFGGVACDRLRQQATLRAACALAERYQHGLADRIGFRAPWDWSSFARLLTRLSGPLTPPVRADLAGIGGRWWTHG